MITLLNMIPLIIPHINVSVKLPQNHLKRS